MARMHRSLHIRLRERRSPRRPTRSANQIQQVNRKDSLSYQRLLIRRIGPVVCIFDLDDVLLEILRMPVHVRLRKQGADLEYRNDGQEPHEEIDQSKEESDRPDE